MFSYSNRRANAGLVGRARQYPLSIELSLIEGYWYFYLISAQPSESIYSEDYKTRKEATLAAIDAALKYLDEHKKGK